MYLENTEVETIRDLLNLERDRVTLSLKVSADEVSAVQSTGVKDEVDSANDSIFIAQKTRFINRENLYLKKVHGAIQKLDKKEYGICEDCGGEIPFKRLKARLTSNMCIVCKEESEQAENCTVTGRRSKSLGKDLSMSASA